MLYPDNASLEAAFTVAGCVVEASGKVLLLQRASHKPQPGKWGMPSGKVDAGESNEAAIARELFEEAGIIAQLEDFELVRSVKIRHEDYDFEYVLYFLRVSAQTVKTNPQEHSAYQWIVPGRVKAEVDGIEDLIDCLALRYKELL
jgi:8-oxo-dGTP pyrophosphatase MutT (NUDIX family)